ncbi:nuclear transport factor 2 family protein [Citromicrobium bathyomarinum]|uniref:nuclear transport factor 2 family protein n=1 Tax=Citromicrobium bathyomarinum TaxID=72174 RepID=UPI001E40012F|nr:nuclear transport factor 2 family protein [Citromicrobium bathyomarinum]MCD1622743.1 nuclear transport factor 2 family protein [Citromicrobium bathyomarinum]
MTPTQQGLAEWHTLATAPDPERLARLVAQDAVFHSPVVHTPQEGRALVVSYLSAAAATLGQGEFRYVRELVDGQNVMLEFTCVLDGIQVNGVDIIRFDEAGMIADFKVMIRPIKAVNKVWEMMAAELEKASAS